MRTGIAALITTVVLVLPTTMTAYPLDGATAMGIRRLEADTLTEQQRPRLPPGARLGRADVRLHLADTNPDWDIDASSRDTKLQSALDSIFQRRDPSYSVMVVDITDPENIVWAGRRESEREFPGSVGKVLCMIAYFDGLRRAFPDVEERRRVLRETEVVATFWATGDNFHKVPHFDPATRTNRYAAVKEGDRFNLAEWLDHMISASANSAGATVWKEAMLLRHFGSAYPPTLEQERAFFRETKPADLQSLSQSVIDDPLREAGIDVERIQQGTMWTKPAQARVPGMSSFATPRELVRVLLRIEQGRMVDQWSSQEMKRYLYMTRGRYRYVYPPELRESAVYFKSGSYFRCEPEEGYDCGKYRGNKTNIMNSIAIIESPAQPGPQQRRYLVSLTSNVLRVNSAWDHARLGAAIDEAVRTRQAVRVREEGSERDVRAAGGDG